MAKGVRLRLLTQAVLVWSGEDSDLEDIVETGRLGEISEVLPFNQEMRDEIVKQYQGEPKPWQAVGISKPEKLS